MKKFLLLIKTFGVGFLLSELRKFAASLSDVPEMQDFVNSRVNEIDKVVQIITDNDPDNKKQFRKLYEENREDFSDDVLLLAAKKVEEKLFPTDPERAAYLANVLRQIAEIDLFKPVIEPPIPSPLENQFPREETARGKKGNRAQAFEPEVKPQTHSLPESEPEQPFNGMNDAAAVAEGEAVKE